MNRLKGKEEILRKETMEEVQTKERPRRNTLKWSRLQLEPHVLLGASVFLKQDISPGRKRNRSEGF